MGLLGNWIKLPQNKVQEVLRIEHLNSKYEVLGLTRKHKQNTMSRVPHMLYSCTSASSEGEREKSQEMMARFFQSGWMDGWIQTKNCTTQNYCMSKSFFKESRTKGKSQQMPCDKYGSHISRGTPFPRSRKQKVTLEKGEIGIVKFKNNSLKICVKSIMREKVFK